MRVAAFLFGCGGTAAAFHLLCWNARGGAALIGAVIAMIISAAAWLPWFRACERAENARRRRVLESIRRHDGHTL